MKLAKCVHFRELPEQSNYNLGAFTQQKWVVSQLCRVQAQHGGVSRSMCLLKPLGEKLPCLFCLLVTPGISFCLAVHFSAYFLLHVNKSTRRSKNTPPKLCLEVSSPPYPSSLLLSSTFLPIAEHNSADFHMALWQESSFLSCVMVCPSLLRSHQKWL